MKHIPQLSLGGREIGTNFPPLVVAEIGINHGGSLEVAMRMVDAAKRAGVEVVKHQTHVIEDEMSHAAKRVIPGNSDQSIFEIMKSCALDEADEQSLKNYVEAAGMIFLSTPFSRAAANRLRSFGVCGYKIGSGECNNIPLLEHVASFGKPIILSTGMNDLVSVARAVDIFRRHAVPFALLHCTNVYPTPSRLVRLDCITELRLAFPDAVVGLSDHTLSNISCLGAVALGASILERHFTDHYQRSGPDIEVSMDETACAQLIADSIVMHECRGGGKRAVPEERVTMDFAFASVVTVRDIKAGEVLSTENLWVKRPGTGEILADQYATLIDGTYRATCDIARDELLRKAFVTRQG